MFDRYVLMMKRGPRCGASTFVESATPPGAAREVFRRVTHIVSFTSSMYVEGTKLTNFLRSSSITKSRNDGMFFEPLGRPAPGRAPPLALIVIQPPPVETDVTLMYHVT